MKFKLSIILILVSFSKISAQQYLWHDNRNNSVTEYFTQTDIVSSLSRENDISGVICFQVTVNKKGNIVKSSMMFSSDTLLNNRIENYVKNSSGKWKIKKGLGQQNFQIIFIIANESLDSILKKELQKPININFSRFLFRTQTAVDNVTQFPIIYIKYKRPVRKPSEVIY